MSNEAQILDTIAESIAKHALPHDTQFNNVYKHGHEKAGQEILTNSKSFKPPLDPPVKSLSDMKKHIKNVLTDPNTKFVILESIDNPGHHSIQFFNESKNINIAFNSTQTFMVNPHTGKVDGFAGSAFRQKNARAPDGAVKRLGKANVVLETAIKSSETNYGFKRSSAILNVGEHSSQFHKVFATHFDLIKKSMKGRQPRTPAEMIEEHRLSAEARKAKAGTNKPQTEPNAKKTQVTKPKPVDVFEGDKLQVFYDDMSGKSGYALSENKKSVIRFQEGMDPKIQGFDSVQEANQNFGEKVDAYARKIDPRTGDPRGMPDVLKGSFSDVAKQLNALKNMPKAKKAFFKAASYLRKSASFLGKAFKVLAPVSMTLGAIEARGMHNKAAPLVDYGLMTEGALGEYDCILAAHVLTDLDPTLAYGEAAVKASFEAWEYKNEIKQYISKDMEPKGMMGSIVSALTGSEKRTLQHAAIETIAEQDWLPVQLRIVLNDPNVYDHEKNQLAVMAVAKRMGTLQIHKMDGFVVYSFGETTVQDIPMGKLLGDIKSGEAMPVPPKDGGRPQFDFKIETVPRDVLKPPEQIQIIDQTQFQSGRTSAVNFDDIKHMKLADPANTHANLMDVGGGVVRLEEIRRSGTEYIITSMDVRGDMRDLQNDLTQYAGVTLNEDFRAVATSLHNQYKTDMRRAELEAAIAEVNDAAPQNADMAMVTPEPRNTNQNTMN